MCNADLQKSTYFPNSIDVNKDLVANQSDKTLFFQTLGKKIRKNGNSGILLFRFLHAGFLYAGEVCICQKW